MGMATDYGQDPQTHLFVSKCIKQQTIHETMFFLLLANHFDLQIWSKKGGWIGYAQLSGDENAPFQWISCSGYDYTNWGPGEPSMSAESQQYGKWYDAIMSARLPVIQSTSCLCEYDPVQPGAVILPDCAERYLPDGSTAGHIQTLPWSARIITVASSTVKAVKGVKAVQRPWPLPLWWPWPWRWSGLM